MSLQVRVIFSADSGLDSTGLVCGGACGWTRPESTSPRQAELNSLMSQNLFGLRPGYKLADPATQDTMRKGLAGISKAQTRRQ
jgi:hypothetical protein